MSTKLSLDLYGRVKIQTFTTGLSLFSKGLDFSSAL